MSSLYYRKLLEFNMLMNVDTNVCPTQDQVWVGDYKNNLDKHNSKI